MPLLQLQVKVKKIAELTYLEANKQQTKYRLTYLESCKERTIDLFRAKAVHKR